MTQNHDSRLVELEKICSDGRVVFFMVGLALEEIKQKKLYEIRGFDNFPAYCDSIGYSRRHANQLIASGTAVRELPAEFQSLVQSERAARELSKIPQALRISVITAASNNGTKPATASSIKSSAPPPRKAKQSAPPPPPRKAHQPSKPKPVVDFTGIEIPKEITATWMRSAEVNEILSVVSSLRSRLESAQESRDILFVEVDFTDSLAKLNQVFLEVKRARPYAVCPSCQGKLIKGCLTCKGRGFVSEFYWKTAVPEEIKNIRAQK